MATFCLGFYGFHICCLSSGLRALLYLIVIFTKAISNLLSPLLLFILVSYLLDPIQDGGSEAHKLWYTLTYSSHSSLTTFIPPCFYSCPNILFCLFIFMFCQP